MFVKNHDMIHHFIIHVIMIQISYHMIYIKKLMVVKKSKSYYFVLYNIFSFRGKYYAQYRYIFIICNYKIIS